MNILVVHSNNSVISFKEIVDKLKDSLIGATFQDITEESQYAPYTCIFSKPEEYSIKMTQIIKPDNEIEFNRRTELLRDLINEFIVDNQNNDYYIVIHASAIGRKHEGYFPALSAIADSNVCPNKVKIYSTLNIEENQFPPGYWGTFSKTDGSVQKTVDIIIELLHVN